LGVRVGINGFGSIGRRFYRQVFDRDDMEVVAVNDVADVRTSAHLLKYDSTYGTFPPEVRVDEGGLSVGGRRLRFFSERDPGRIPWRDAGVDVVLESTGLFTDAARARAHIDGGGAKRVVISAPAKGEDLTVVLGVNEGEYDPSRHRIVSNASCTTNCLAVTAKALDDAFRIRRALVSTVHAYTNDQRVLDLPHPDLRRARAAAQNIIPTSSGASKAVEKALPHLRGKMNAFALRVPVASVSVVDLVAEVEREATADSVNAAFEEAAAGPLRGLLAVSREELVSSDFRGDPHSAIVDAPLTQVVDGHLVKVIAWYDNEWGYCARLVDLVAHMARRGV
jgi:glyceraldehyde 3-phosphate dehydrogenase